MIWNLGIENSEFGIKLIQTAMKKTVISAIMAFVASSTMAQVASDAILFNRNDYEGTARLQAMGGAFGALGADLSSQTINPAGLASYRATEFAFSVGVNSTNTNTDNFGFRHEDNKLSASLDQMGVSYAWGSENSFSHAFSINYTRMADYNRTSLYYDRNKNNSILDYMCIYPDNAFLGDLGFKAGVLADSYKDNEGNLVDCIHNVWEIPIGKNKVDQDARADANGGLIDHEKYVKERGSKGEIDFSYAINISPKLYLGASIGVQSLTRREKTLLHESFRDYDPLTIDGYYYDNINYATYLDQDGAGVNFSFGVIARPIQYIRLGAAIHSPTFFHIEESYSADLTSFEGNAYSKHASSGEYEYEYRYYTPGRLDLSVAGVIGNYGIVSVDYEYSNYERGKFKEHDDDLSSDTWGYDEINNQIKDTYGASHTLRIGAEVKPIESLAIRAGYKMQNSPYDDSVTKYDYIHRSVSGGIGYRSNNFFVDLTYVNTLNQYDYWVLPNDGPNTYLYADNEPAKGESKTHKFMFTLGFRF